jgi:hypothetical protein
MTGGAARGEFPCRTTTAAAGRRHRVVTSILVLLLTLSLLLVIDLDRHRTGGITISQQPMAGARAAMR